MCLLNYTCSRIEGCAVTVESRALKVEEERASCPCTKECTDSNCDVYRAFKVWSFTFNCSRAWVRWQYIILVKESWIRDMKQDLKIKIFYTPNLTESDECGWPTWSLKVKKDCNCSSKLRSCCCWIPTPATTRDRSSFICSVRPLWNVSTTFWFFISSSSFLPVYTMPENKNYNQKILPFTNTITTPAFYGSAWCWEMPLIREGKYTDFCKQSLDVLSGCLQLLSQLGGPTHEGFLCNGKGTLEGCNTGDRIQRHWIEFRNIHSNLDGISNLLPSDWQ